MKAEKTLIVLLPVSLTPDGGAMVTAPLSDAANERQNAHLGVHPDILERFEHIL